MNKKGNMIKHLYGISGQEEALALNQFFPKNKYPEDVDDSGCTDDEPDNFNETSYLEDCAYSTYGDLEG
jgi:hypothetical protein